MTHDRRVTPARPDLAAAHLRGQVAAERYVDGEPMRVAAGILDMRDRPDPEEALSTQLLHGEAVTVYDMADGFAWVQSAIDGYVGYVDAAGLGPAGPEADAHVTSVGTQVYAVPELKAAPLRNLPWMARVSILETSDTYVRTGAGWCPAQHIATTLDADPVGQAERLLGVPYLWGGRSPAGLDCSALVQLAFAAAGHALPRDSDLQEAALPEAPGQPVRGDLVFWRGHVGIMQDGERLLHANAHHMAVASEPLEIARARIAATATGPITSIRRVPAA